MEILKAHMVADAVKTGGAARVHESIPANFRVGDIVQVKNLHPIGHTRMPRYVRGKLGKIVICHGVFITPDTTAHGEGHCPQNVYAVAFKSRELWGQQANAADQVIVDLWDSYLERVQ